MRRRLTAMLLSLAMVFTFMPVMAFAEVETATYTISVDMITAGIDHYTGEIKEVNKKADVSNPVYWVATEKDLDGMKAYWSGDTSATYQDFRGIFQAGETYYNVAIVKFKEGETADPAQVGLVETDYIRRCGASTVNTTENTVILPFAVTIPAVTVTVEFGSNHAKFAADIAKLIKTTKAEVSGSKLSYKAQKGSDLWYDAMDPIREALHKSRVNVDNGEQLYDRSYLNFKPLGDYSDAEDWEKDYGKIDGKANNDVKFYVQWQKPAKSGNVVIKTPVCGTTVKAEKVGDGFYHYEQKPLPEVTASGDSELVPPTYYSEDTNLARMFSDGVADIEMTDFYFPDKWYKGPVIGGKIYRVGVPLYPVFGYYVDPDNLPAVKVNGEKARVIFDIYERYPVILADVKAEHNWGGWKVTKQPTTTEEGVEERACRHCGVKETRPVDKLPPDDPSVDPGKKTDPATAKTTAFVAKAVAKGKTSLKLTWKKRKDADRYVIYMAKCGKNLKKVRIVKASKNSFTKRGLEKNTKYKFKIVAQKRVNGKWKTVAKTKSVHAVTGNVSGKFTNPKSVKTKPAAMTLSVGQSKKVKSYIKKVKGGKQLLKHTKKLRYKSSDSSVAKVSKSGKVTAVKSGTCKIYVQAVNGIWKTVTVTVQ